MKRTLWWGIVVALAAGIAAAFYYWQQGQEQALPPPAPQAATPPAPPTPQPSPEPAIRHPLDTAAAPGEAGQPVPALDESDAPLRQALAGLLGPKSLAALFYPDGIIRRIVATVDNLPRKKLAPRLIPVKPAPGKFAVSGARDKAVIGPANGARYAPYVRIAQAVDAPKLTAVYVRFYPLFQRAYEELGYPRGYFNDRLVEAIDDLLAAPAPQGPIKLVQPKVFYEYADPELEQRSAGQKIMMRMGNENAAKLKDKLGEIRREVTRRGPRK